MGFPQTTGFPTVALHVDYPHLHSHALLLSLSLFLSGSQLSSPVLTFDIKWSASGEKIINWIKDSELYACSYFKGNINTKEGYP